MKVCKRGHERPTGSGRCRECVRENGLARRTDVAGTLAAWKAAHPERAAAAKRAWALTHPEKRRAAKAKYHAANRAKDLVAKKRRIAARPEKYAAAEAAWREKNRAKLNAEARRRGAQLSDAYVAQLIGVSVKDAPKELLDLKRTQVTLHRLGRQIKAQVKESK